MADTLTDDERPQVAAVMSAGEPERANVHLKREALLAQLFPTQVHRPKLGRYDVLEFVGEGGMGTVFAAYDPQLDRRVAVKLLRRQSAGDRSRRARLLREAKALARLSDPHIVTIHEVWEEHGEVHLAMEFIEGDTLAQWHREARPWREVLAAYRQAGQGLAAAHAAGLVYRDFKPHNVIRRSDGVVKLLDFGLARLDEEAPDPTGRNDAVAGAAVADDGEPGRATDPASVDDHLTRPGAIMGTPAYMAPEQRRGEVADARSDQFGFCVALWEGLYGELPFARVSAVDPADLGERVQPRRVAEVPSWVRQVVERGLAIDPSQRHASMDELLRGLARDPAVVRRRVLGVGGALVVALGAGFAVAQLRTEPQCVAASAWDDDRRQTVREGVLGSEVVGAEATWDLLDPRLQRHATQMVQLREAACVAHARGMLPDAHYERQVACFDRRQVGFDTVVDLLAAGQPAAVTNANKAVADLPEPEGCTDIDALLAEQRPPDDPVDAQEVVELRQELSRASAEESAGQYEQAEARAGDVLGRARAIDYPPLVAEALVRLGSVQMQLERDDAQAHLDEALWISIAQEQRASAAEAAAKRIYVRVELVDRLAEVGEAIDLAQALVDRPGAADWRLRWTLHNNIGVAHDRGGRGAEALASYQAALDTIPSGDERGAYERAVSLMNMAPVQVTLAHAAQAESSGREAVEQFVTLFGAEHPHVGITEASLADVLADVGRYAEAERMFDAVLARYDDADVPMWLWVARAKIEQRREDGEGLRTWSARARRWLPPMGEAPTSWHTAVEMLDAWAAALDGNPQAVEIIEAWLPRVEGRQRMRVQVQRAEIELRFGNAVVAEGLLRPFVDDDSVPELNARGVRLLLGVALAKQERWGEARERLLAVVAEARQPGRYSLRQRSLALAALSEVERARGSADDALRHAEQARDAVRSFDPDSPEVVHAERIVAQARAARAQGGGAPVGATD